MAFENHEEIYRLTKISLLWMMVYRYVNLWSSIEPLRVDSEWWESTMLPLKQLEAAATSGPAVLPPPSVPFQTSLNELKNSDSTLNGRDQGDDVKAATLKSTSDPQVGVSDKSAGYLPQFTPRAVREDMELDTKLYTEPLPTSQQVCST